METQSVFIDGIKTLGVHNNAVRIELFQLQPDGRPNTEIMMVIPTNVVPSLVDALNKAVKR